MAAKIKANGSKLVTHKKIKKKWFFAGVLAVDGVGARPALSVEQEAAMMSATRGFAPERLMVRRSELTYRD